MYVMSVCTAAPPAYTSSVTQQPLSSQTSHFTSPAYQPAFADAAPPSSGYGGGDVMPPTKI